MVWTRSARRRSRSWPGRSGRTSSSRLTGFARTWRAPWWGRAIPLDWNSGPMHENATNGYDLIIVGGGPAGLCAAMYAGRGMLKAVTIERGAPGGELLNTDLIEDYIGFASIKGWDLAQKMTEHATKFGADIVTDTVERIRKADDGWFDVETARGKVYRAPAVILTAGGTPGSSGCRVSRSTRGRGSPIARCATARSSRASCLRSWAAATPPSRRRTTSPGTRARSTSCTAAIASAPRRSSRSARWQTPRST